MQTSRPYPDSPVRGCALALTCHRTSLSCRGNVAAARQLLQEFGALEPSATHPSGTEISINEMVPMGSNFDPATHISYFANLERVRCQHTAEVAAFVRSPRQCSCGQAAVASACHSCWASPCPPGAVPDSFSNSCYNCGQHDTKGVHGSMSLDGMLTSDGKEMPRSIWWAYKACERPAPASSAAVLW